jgi:hypothetical protein
VIYYWLIRLLDQVTRRPAYDEGCEDCVAEFGPR